MTSGFIPGNKQLIFKAPRQMRNSLIALIFFFFPPSHESTRMFPVKNEAAEVSWQQERSACRLKCQMIYPDQVGKVLKCQRL